MVFHTGLLFGDRAAVVVPDSLVRVPSGKIRSGGEDMEVETHVAAEETEVLRIVRDDRCANLAGAQRDEEVVPKPRDLGTEMGFPVADFRQKIAGSFPRGCARCYDPSKPVEPTAKVMCVTTSDLVLGARA
jgi:hypothetical protein